MLYDDVTINETMLSYKGTNYKLSDIKNVGYFRKRIEHRTNFVKTGETQEDYLLLKFSNNKELVLQVYDKIFTSAEKIEKDRMFMSNLFYDLKQKTFETRVNRYLQSIKDYGYFEYMDCKFFVNDKKVIIKNTDYHLSDWNFMKGATYICVEKKQKDLMSALKKMWDIPQFATIFDEDIIFQLLDKYMGLRWS